MVPLLTEAEIQARLDKLPGWTLDGNTIKKHFKFKNFVEAIAFVDKLVEPSESANHHPDLTVGYGKVIVNLSTHDAGGITQKDFALAATFDQLLPSQ